MVMSSEEFLEPAEEMPQTHPNLTGRLQETVSQRRMDLHTQHAIYRRQREIFLKAAASLVKTVESPTKAVKYPNALQKKHEKLQNAVTELNIQEERTRSMENDLSQLESWLAQVKVQFHDENGVDERSSANRFSIETGDIGSLQSTSSSTTDSPSPSAQLGRKKEAIGFLEERLEELDYEHQMELGFNNEGEPFQSAQRVIQEYEQHRAAIMLQLVTAQEEVRRLERDQYELQGISLPLQSSDVLSHLNDGGIARFPGTHNGALGWGLPHNRVATGFASTFERVEQWWGSIPFGSSAEDAANAETLAPIRSVACGLEDTMDQDLHSFSQTRLPHFQSEGSTGRKHYKLSLWHGDAPSRRYSDSLLRHNYVSSEVERRCSIGP